jgi:hypothetical protein
MTPRRWMEIAGRRSQRKSESKLSHSKNVGAPTWFDM